MSKVNLWPPVLFVYCSSLPFSYNQFITTIITPISLDCVSFCVTLYHFLLADISGTSNSLLLLNLVPSFSIHRRAQSSMWGKRDTAKAIPGHAPPAHEGAIASAQSMGIQEPGDRPFTCHGPLPPCQPSLHLGFRTTSHGGQQQCVSGAAMYQHFPHVMGPMMAPESLRPNKTARLEAKETGMVLSGDAVVRQESTGCTPSDICLEYWKSIKQNSANRQKYDRLKQRVSLRWEELWAQHSTADCPSSLTEDGKVWLRKILKTAQLPLSDEER